MMRLIRWLALLALLAGLPGALRAQAAPARQAGADGGRLARELRDAEEEWVRALVARDARAFRRLVHPGFVYTDERGVFTRDSLVAEVTAGSDTVTWAGNDSMVVHLHGTTGVVTGILSTRGRGASGEFAHRYRFTDTWMRRNGRWVCIAAQDYDMPPR